MIILRHLPIEVSIDGDLCIISQRVGDLEEEVVTIKISRDQGLQVAAFLNDNLKAKRTKATGSLDGFAEFWEAYPRKEVKAASKRLWTQKNLSGYLPTIIAHIEASKASDGWRRGFIPMATTYLNQRRWEDLEESSDIFADAH